jgi:hypothetical protein
MWNTFQDIRHDLKVETLQEKIGLSTQPEWRNSLLKWENKILFTLDNKREDSNQ